MKKTIFSSIILIMPLCIFGQNWAGTWRVSPEAGALHVGPGDGSTWWANSLGDVTTRECYFDDEYVFNADGSFSNVLGTETWIEAWQGIAADGCGAPVSPHDGSNAATYTYTDSTVTLSGVGAYLGLPKVYNGGELGAANADSAITNRTYDIALSSGNDTMTVTINIGSGIWTYKLAAVPPVEGTWRVSPEAGALHVGPGDGSTWWANSLDDVTTRACYFDDEYVFDQEGFHNDLYDETWIEAWQGIAADGCGTPVYPHDGSNNPAGYTYTASTVTLNGVGAYLGLPKVYNGGELGAANADSAIASRTYDIAFSSGNDTMTVTINIGSGIWTYKLVAVQPSTGVISDIVPTEFSLANNYPNPFNPTTTISFSIPKQLDVGLNIYNVIGQLVANVAKGRLDAGIHNVQWNGRDHNGNVLPSGLYFYELVGGKQFRKVKKMTLVK